MKHKPSLVATDDPQWYKDAVIYQLHLKSFFDANNDGIGDFQGLLQKLDYIVELGVDTLWLLPFFPSPRLDDGYDIAEYRNVHPDYGTMRDARAFVEAAHARGLRVIIELVINHTSDQHPWFQRARKAKPGSSHRNFYVWSDDDKKYGETRIIFIDTERSNWTWDPVAKAYFWHRFYSHQPDLNFDNPQVLRAVLSVMHYWLDLGVDGLRLDAIPYLVEREGTNNENLPETHAVLKRIRAELDASYKNRMLLAEANQWPEDTRPYFGDDNECHMAFHFPLMPRMYMAIAREDRFPITDILRQTPEIPESCQWAIFLRNHDELTLEMVTDSERDYLWNVYASDRRARLNLGIRRRLAPLLERDRRRIELMNSLLLSMPGTPVLYYGDEIGMGDNIHLGDRDGVRTPMQWSPDRNGGFSRADPASLVLPPIMDSVYGFQAVNVEAQSHDQHSILNWTRRKLAVRRQHRTFGRGSLRILYPRNRKMLAYLRQYEDETILCVANLSRQPRAVELDLAEFAGRVPIELDGAIPFPPIGQLTYLLTLPAYGFYWFVLAAEAELPAWHTPAPETMPEYVTLVVRSSLSEMLAGSARSVLEKDTLPTYLPMRRWFGAKGEALQESSIVDATNVPGAQRETLLLEIEARTARTKARYILPLSVLWEDEPGNAALPQQLALARVRRGRRVGLLTDAFALPSFAHDVMAGLRASRTIPCDDGEIRFLPTSRIGEVDTPDDAEITWVSVEQSNSSLAIGDIAIMKLIRRVSNGIHPEAEMGRYLTENGFAHAAPLFGEVVRTAADGTPRTLGIVQGFIRNQGDGWAWTLDYLARTIEDLAVRDEAEVESGFVEAFHLYAEFATTLGRRLGEMHVTLSRPTEDPAFAPQSATREDVAAWAAGTRAQLEAAFDVLEATTDWAGPGEGEIAADLLARRDGLFAVLGRLADEGRDTPLIRIHGDLHLGQVLVAGGDVVIIDFEGEPAKPLDQRRAKSSALRDVAGVVRSFDYAAAMVNKTGADRLGHITEGFREKLLDRFRQDAIAAFLDGYRGTSQRLSAEAEAALLDLFVLEKAAYEVCYEAANRPAWLGVPLRGLAVVTDRLVGAAPEQTDE